MKIIDGTGLTLGRLASFAAKNALKGEEIKVLNCENVIITGNKKDILEEYRGKRKWVGSTQKGPKYSRNIDRIVKVTIRGMLPDYRKGRGRIAYKRIRCYIGVPKEFENSKREIFEKREIKKSYKVGDIFK
jgi:large subunit ribosomal protein L13